MVSRQVAPVVGRAQPQKAFTSIRHHQFKWKKVAP
jgi:hypothetical protein